MAAMPKRLAVASLSARALVEAAHTEGYRPVALDLFGDADTRRAAEAWMPIGNCANFAIDGRALLAALLQLRGEGRADAWIAGSGFEGQPELLEAGSRILPLIGNRPQTVARIRSPATFFARLAALGIPYPETSLAFPSPPSGWLRKDAGSCGGWEVKPAMVMEPARSASVHYQRVAPGQPMSALFLAGGGRSHLLGVNVQIARRLGARPYVFHGCIGPVDLPPAFRYRLGEWLDVLAGEFGLRGFNGLDFLFDGERMTVLELNPRPPASLALYRGVLPGGLIGFHVAASLDGQLPKRVPAKRSGPRRGFLVVFARRSCHVGPAAITVLASLTWCHDLPAVPTRLRQGNPVCTITAEGSSVAAVQTLLQQRRRQILSLLEKSNEARSSRSHPVPVSRESELECQ